MLPEILRTTTLLIQSYVVDGKILIAVNMAVDCQSYCARILVVIQPAHSAHQVGYAIIEHCQPPVTAKCYLAVFVGHHEKHTHTEKYYKFLLNHV